MRAFVAEAAQMTQPLEILPDEHGRFGSYGGRFAPEVLMPALLELEAAWRERARGPDLPRRARRRTAATTPDVRRRCTAPNASGSASAPRSG